MGETGYDCHEQDEIGEVLLVVQGCAQDFAEAFGLVFLPSCGLRRKYREKRDQSGDEKA